MRTKRSINTSVLKLNGVEAVLIYIVLMIFFVIVSYPLIWTVYTAFKPQIEIFENPFKLPKEIFWGNFERAMGTAKFDIYLINSLIVVIPSLVGIIFLSTCCGYAFARFRFKASKKLFYLFLLGVMIPQHAIVVFVYKVISELHLVDTYSSLVLTYLSWIPVGVYIMHAYFLSIPDEILESAYVDGCKEFSIYWKIVLPLAIPSIATIAIYYFVWVWNNFLYPLLMIQSTEKNTIPLGLMLFKSKYTVDWGLQCAALTIASLPAILMYFIFQSYFVEGLTAGAVKG